MKLHTVFITYNRLELTKQAIESYLETVSVPFTLVVVDNGSTDGTQEWLTQWNNDTDRPYGSGILLFRENQYPGRATNRGWAQRLEGNPGFPIPGEESHLPATHLHRADNDFAFLPGWCERVQEMFVMTKIGQVGLRTDAEENYTIRNTGGNCVIRKELWDQGLRWDERPWPDFPPLRTEDTYFSPAVRALGWTWKRVKEPCIVPLASGDLNDPYYQETYSARGISDPSQFQENLGIAPRPR